MTLAEARKTLGWSKTELAKRAKINKRTAFRAENGKTINGHSAQAIAETLSQALGRKVLPGDLGLNVL